jgi:hypothetical protein
LILYCPNRKDRGQVVVEICLYNCKLGTKCKCSAYRDKWPLILAYVVPEFYLAKYGEPVKPVPLALRKRRRKPTQQEIK